MADNVQWTIMCLGLLHSQVKQTDHTHQKTSDDGVIIVCAAFVCSVQLSHVCFSARYIITPCEVWFCVFCVLLAGPQCIVVVLLCITHLSLSGG